MGKTERTKKKEILSEAEKKRLERFEGISDDMTKQGYTRHDLTINMGKANLFAVLLLIPLAVIGFGLYYLVNHGLEWRRINFLILLVALIMLIVAHELIHGLSWSLFTPGRFKDVEFGILRSSLTPYCACLVPLKKAHYFFGSVMPLVILGIIPMIIGIVIGNPLILFLGIIMADSAAGDLMIIARLLGYKSSAEEIIYMDHPTQAGGVVFER
ncbi:MAG: DUF3267 domain-containing protein [Lachnospiraceae bacterium]|nr:DUF3267 domain-containing protein [Lachnospiraceae bacterium]